MAVWSVVNKTDLQSDSRIDAEYYQPQHLRNDAKICSYGYVNLGNIASFSGGATPLGANYLSSGIPFLRIQNIGDNQLILDDIVFIDRIIHDGLLKRSRLQYGDVLITITGRIGTTAVVSDDIKEGNINQHIVRIRIHDKRFNPFFLSTFLNTAFGRLQTIREAYGSTRDALPFYCLSKIKISLIPENGQKTIEEIVKQAFNKVRESESLYFEAEQLLLSELGIKKLDFAHRLTYKTNLSDIQTANRFDAEYFQPKYETIIVALKKASQKRKVPLTTLGEISQPMKYGTSEPFDYIEKGIPFLRIADVSNLDFDSGTVMRIPERQAEKCTNERVQSDDLLISRSGTLGMVIPIDKRFDNAIFGSYFIRIRPKIDISCSYLKVFYNSIIGKLIVERLQTGAIQTNLTIPAIEKFPLLLSWPQLEEKIDDLINKSKQARMDAELLLHQAKQKIEELIEKQSHWRDKLRGVWME
jgi:restriction endonuclease S subunit